MDEKPHSSSVDNRRQAFLSTLISGPDIRPRYRQIVLAGTVIFLTAFTVRLIHLQDYQLNIAAVQGSLAGRYKQQAQRMLDGNGVLYPTGYRENSNAQLLVHPPGYSIFIAIVYRLFGQSDYNLARVQVVCDSLAAVLVMIIGLQLFRFAASV